jgi:hypothetical protein
MKGQRVCGSSFLVGVFALIVQKKRQISSGIFITDF